MRHMYLLFTFIGITAIILSIIAILIYNYCAAGVITLLLLGVIVTALSTIPLVKR